MSTQRKCKRGPKPPRKLGWQVYLEWCAIECDCRKCWDR